MTTPFFQGIKQWEFDWEGRKARLPVFYYDNTAVTAIYTASTRAVRGLLPHPDMTPVELRPGRCLAAFTAFEYRDTDIDPYNEFSIAFLIAFGGRQIPGLTASLQMMRRSYTAYIWQLPVTTEIARVGGVELYGYPKFLSDIEFSERGGRLTCELSEEGVHILTLEGRKLKTRRGKQVHFQTYSVCEGIPLAANVLQNPLEYAQSSRPGAARLTLGSEHPIARTLRTLGLSKRPIKYQYSPRNEAILFGGRNLVDC